MTNMILLANVLSHLEMRKAVVHGKSHFLSMESIASTFMYNGLLKSPFVKKLPEELKPVSMPKKVTHIIT